MVRQKKKERHEGGRGRRERSREAGGPPDSSRASDSGDGNCG